MSNDMFSKADELEDERYRELAKDSTLSKPDIDDLREKIIEIICDEDRDSGAVTGWRLDVDKAATQLLEALYHRLAAEAVYADVLQYGKNDKRVPFVIKAVPLSKLKAIMEIKE